MFVNINMVKNKSHSSNNAAPTIAINRYRT